MWKKQGLGVRGTNVMLYSKRLGDPENTELWVQADNDEVEAITVSYNVQSTEPRRFQDVYAFIPPYMFMRWTAPVKEKIVLEDWNPEPGTYLDGSQSPINLKSEWKFAFDELKKEIPEIGESLDLCIRRLERPGEFV